MSPSNVLLFFISIGGICLKCISSQGQPYYSHLLNIPSNETITNLIGGVYTNNVTLYFRNSPYRVQTDLTVEQGATLIIETGVRIYFDTGVGLKVKGTIHAVGNEFAHIQMLPHQKAHLYDDVRPDIRLIDGQTINQGRLQIKFRDRWRSVCTKLTNWTAIDVTTACRSLGYTDGGFWKWFRRNNDTYPFVMPQPGCLYHSSSLWNCVGFKDPNRIDLSENLCQGEDDIGLRCWGPPTFIGWSRHWKGLQILNSAFSYKMSDPDAVSIHKESLSRLEYIDILYAGYDGALKNRTAALWIQGVAPVLNGMRIENSALDGIYIQESSAPVVIANSTIRNNRGYGVLILNTTDGRVFINSSLIENNYGDGIRYQQKFDYVQFSTGQKEIIQQFSTDEKIRIEICAKHFITESSYFPHLIELFLANGTVIDSDERSPCWMVIQLPSRLEYTYSFQFLHVENLNTDEDSDTKLIICDANDKTNHCKDERIRIPVINGVLPQSLSVRSFGNPILILLDEKLTGSRLQTTGDIHMLFRIHASVTDKAFYGLNLTNSIINNNTGCGVHAEDIRDRFVFSNISVIHNEGLAGVLVRNGAADIWVNASRIENNWGDGLNISYAGGSIMVNGTSVSYNRWRGCAVHYNNSYPFLPLRQEVIFKGRPLTNMYYLRTIIADNKWGGILIGNFCIPAYRNIQPKITINWVELVGNHYHPAIEIHSCQRDGVLKTIVDITGNRIEGGSGIGFRMEPAVNLIATIISNQFLSNNNTAFLIRNAQHPQLSHLPAKVTISKNSFKFNSGQNIVSIGLNEGGTDQTLIFNQQNEVRENQVINPFPYLNPRSFPYAAVIVSSSNVILHRNCFKNPRAKYEIATELSEHAKWINASENNWGSSSPDLFMDRIFDQFNRYSLASIEVDPFAAVCNHRNPRITRLRQYYRLFRKDTEPFIIGGTIWENQDLIAGKYTVVDDLNIVPGARLTISPGTVLEFANGIGMLVQGELVRADLYTSDDPVIFTSQNFRLSQPPNIRIVDENDNYEVTAGRLEVFVGNEWGTVCNRSWTARHALLACQQLGLLADIEYFENWRTFVPAGDLPIVMDNIRCEEREYDLTMCRHDGRERNVGATCAPTEVVGIRCLEPRWAGVRFSLPANPPAITGQPSMHKWIIEKAGLFDFRIPLFTAALQIDWNYHVFHNITIRDNFWDGIDIIYNDLIKKPAIINARIENNRRHGLKIRSMGITIENVIIRNNGNAGLRYNSFVSAPLQRDIVAWLERREQPEEDNVFVIPNSRTTFTVKESHLNQRKFLLARTTADCPLHLSDPCIYEATITASGYEYGLNSRIAIQIVNRASALSDEEITFIDEHVNKEWSVRHDIIRFPIISSFNTLKLKYARTYGHPRIVLLILFLDAQEYLDHFVHVLNSVITRNQYGMAALHYSNLSTVDGDLLNRWSVGKIWLQKTNFTYNREAALWIHSPQHEISVKTPVAKITYHVDNCSFANNTGPLVQTARDSYASANAFSWKFWSNTFETNTNMAIWIHLPDLLDLTSKIMHSFLMTENRFIDNQDFMIRLGGFHAFVNISSNNFTKNSSPNNFGLIELIGMEKELFFERNRFISNQGQWVLRMDIQSHSLFETVRAYIQYNYFLFNQFLEKIEDYVDMWPRSFAVGIFGSQMAEVHFNRFRNVLLDFELVSGCKTTEVVEFMNVSHNWWGMANEAGISQRIFDIDDWNIYSLAEFSPFFATEELFINFWWTPKNGQLLNATYNEPSEFDLRGRMYKSKTLSRHREKWHQFPFYYKPDRPYRIIKDLIIMPGATLTVEKGVEVHIWPNVRILVLGDLIADGTFWQPIIFRPINITEYTEIYGSRGTLLKRPSTHRSQIERVKQNANRIKKKRRAEWIGSDQIYTEFPSLIRMFPFKQTLSVRLNGSNERSGFLEVYNATTGEFVPSCDREFTIRNAQVVCNELGLPITNVFHWLTQRWDYNPKILILKSYMEPRQCFGTEKSLDTCPLRLTGNFSMWQCMDNEHFNYIHCGVGRILSSDFVGHWGGIMFAEGTLEERTEQTEMQKRDSSILRHVEIVGGGFAHNETLDVASLTCIHRSPVLENINVTNSSMHAIQIINPYGRIILNRINVTQNLGYGINIWTSNVQGNMAHSATPRGMILLPYNARTMVNICATRKKYKILQRIFIYYKYDSYPVDCVKHFESSGRALLFRFLLVNLYNGTSANIGRVDTLYAYSDKWFKQLVRKYTGSSNEFFAPAQVDSYLALHLRASAADGQYGFIAEVVTLPVSTQSGFTDEVTIRQSRVEENDRGALSYYNTGEIGPSLSIEDCSIRKNGYRVFRNITSSLQAIDLNLQNTPWTQMRGLMVSDNIGGLRVSSETSSSLVRLVLVVRDSSFVYNVNQSTLSFYGSGNQRLFFLNNIVSNNYALYHDTAILRGFSSNFTHNLFTSNTGLHCLELRESSSLSSEPQFLLKNWFYDNVALGHGHQYLERYGFQSERFEYNREKRQVLIEKGISFDWWTHVGLETERYRSTIFAGSSRQVYHKNLFDNPKNPYELTTAIALNFDTGTIDAKENYWGYPGTVGVASGKIRDHNDNDLLIVVDYEPVLESNTSLIDGDCPGGWFQLGVEEFKACFLFVGASATYRSALEYCQKIDAFLPYLRVEDVRQKMLAKRIYDFLHSYSDILDSFAHIQKNFDYQMWISSATVPTIHCAWLNIRTGSIGTQNCNNLLPFVCEKGVKAYEDPPLWRKAVVFSLICLIILFILLSMLALCWYRKSKKRDEEEISRKEFIRASMRLNKVGKANKGKKAWNRNHMVALSSVEPNEYDEDVIAKAHKDMVHGQNENNSPVVSDQVYNTSATLATSYYQSNNLGESINSKSSTCISKIDSYSSFKPFFHGSGVRSSSRNLTQFNALNNHYAVSYCDQNQPELTESSQPTNHGQRDTDSTYYSTSGVTCSTCETDYYEQDSVMNDLSSTNETISVQSSSAHSDDTVVENREGFASLKYIGSKLADSRSSTNLFTSPITTFPAAIYPPNHNFRKRTNQSLYGYETAIVPTRSAPPPPLRNYGENEKTSRSLGDLVNTYNQPYRSKSTQRMFPMETSM